MYEKTKRLAVYIARKVSCVLGLESHISAVFLTLAGPLAAIIDDADLRLGVTVQLLQISRPRSPVLVWLGDQLEGEHIHRGRGGH